MGHLSRVRPSTMVITVSHTVCTRIQPWRRLRHERSRVMRPAPISAVRARSTACRIVSISDSVSTSSFFATRGSASAPMKRNGVQPAKCRNVACTVNAMMNSRRHTIATCSKAAPREPSAFDRNLVRRAADNADPDHHHEQREWQDDATGPPKRAPHRPSAREREANRCTEDNEKPGEIAREKRADDDQEGESNRAVRCHAAEVLAGASMAMNSRGVAR